MEKISRVKGRRSIKVRLVGYFMFVIFISVLVLQLLLVKLVRDYYYNNVASVLTNEIKISSEFYTRYFSNEALETNIRDDVDVFWKQTNAQVQIIDLSGKVLMDSIGTASFEVRGNDDFKKAAQGGIGKWIGNVDYENSKVMAVAAPLKDYNNNIVGVIRFITSLEEVNKQIQQVMFIFVFIGLSVILVVGIVSLFLANSIIEPLKEVTAVAEKMANGAFHFRSKKVYNDEIGRLSDTLNYMAEEIQKKDDLKNDFISSVSHELRTPLTIIKGWSITLNTEELDDHALIKEGLNIIEKESERLSGMVEELLDFSKFVSGKITLYKELVNIEELLFDIQKYMQPRAQRDDIEFSMDCDENIPSIALDKNRIKQVLLNVLDNAFKFTNPKGRIKLRGEYKNKYLLITVADTGAGISHEDLPKVKEKFYKGKSSKSQNGIGLSISDEIVKLHGGDLIIESKLNQGTTVSILIPYNGLSS
jgi:signal transduction histidine kinase